MQQFQSDPTSARTGWIIRLIRRIPEIYRAAITFVVSVVLGVIVSTWLEDEVIGTVDVLAIVVTILCLLVVFFVANSHSEVQRLVQSTRQSITEFSDVSKLELQQLSHSNTQVVRQLAERLGITVEYVEEVYRQPEGIPYQGRIFKRLGQFVENTQFEILALVTTISEQEQEHESDHHSERKAYLRVIEDVIAERHATGFRYERICQVRTIRRRLKDALGATTTEHVRNVLEMQRTWHDSPRLKLAVMKVESQLRTSFIIIDKQIVVLEMNGIDSNKVTYPMALLIFEDRGRRLVPYFESYYDKAVQLARPIASGELT